MQQRKRKYKISTRGKSYKLKDSPLFNLKSKKRLSSLLFTDISTLQRYRTDIGNYNVFLDGSRLIQAPVEALDCIHSRIASLLCRIEQPDYVHSGQKRKSHVSNASVHIDGTKILTTDIKAFFQSTSRIKAFNFFYKRLKCSADVADLLADVCTYNNHIPTGSRISMPLAFWSNFPMFDELASIADRYDINMTLYVDDLTFSGNEVNKHFKAIVNKIIDRHGHTMHPKKTKLYNSADIKVITGVVIKNGAVFIKNSQHKAIYQDMENWKAVRDINNWPFANKGRLLGRLNSLSVIDPKLKDKARSIVQYKKVTLDE